MVHQLRGARPMGLFRRFAPSAWRDVARRCTAAAARAGWVCFGRRDSPFSTHRPFPGLPCAHALRAPRRLRASTRLLRAGPGEVRSTGISLVMAPFSCTGEVRSTGISELVMAPFSCRQADRQAGRGEGRCVIAIARASRRAPLASFRSGAHVAGGAKPHWPLTNAVSAGFEVASFGFLPPRWLCFVASLLPPTETLHGVARRCTRSAARVEWLCFGRLAPREMTRGIAPAPGRAGWLCFGRLPRSHRELLHGVRRAPRRAPDGFELAGKIRACPPIASPESSSAHALRAPRTMRASTKVLRAGPGAVHSAETPGAEPHPSLSRRQSPPPKAARTGSSHRHADPTQTPTVQCDPPRT